MYFSQQLGLSDISSCGSYLNVYVNVGPDLSNQVRVLLLFGWLVGWLVGGLIGWFAGLWRVVPAGSPSRGGDVTVYVRDINQPSFPPPFLFCSCVCFCLYSPFNCISFHKFSQQLSAFSLCTSRLISALLVLSTIYLLMEVSLSPDIIPCG